MSLDEHPRAVVPPVRRAPLRPVEERPVRSWQDRLVSHPVSTLLAAVDLLVLTAAMLATGQYLLTELAIVLLTGVAFASGGLYRSRLTLSLLDDAPQVALRVAAAVGVVTTAKVVFGPVPGSVPVMQALVGITVVVLGRAVSYAVIRSVRRRGSVAHPTLIVGAGKVGDQLSRTLLDHPEYGLQPIGFIDADPLLADDDLCVPVLGGHDELAVVIAAREVHDVVVAFGSAPESVMVDVIRTCDRMNCEIFFVPRLFEVHHTLRGMDDAWGVPLVRLRRSAFRSPLWVTKLLLDRVVAATALALLSPLLAACALAVRLEGGPGVLFRQERVGLDGRPFQLLKFRSMRPASETESATTWNIAHDDRLGRVGRFLRSTSLDELPQLLNILRGQMSLVGPRPERPHFVDAFTDAFPRYTARHRVPAGLTGWAQVHGLRGDTSIEERARFDNQYIENWSLWGDIKIMLRTVTAVLRRHGS